MATSSSCPTCGAPLTDSSVAGLCPACLFKGVLQTNEDLGAFRSVADDLLPGATYGPFRIVGMLGKGGMATVYEAYEAPLERDVALKVLPPEFLHERTFADRFALEGRVVAGLEHPNIVPIYASGIEGGIPWMSMRLLNGGSLADLLSPNGLSIERTTKILSGVAEALDYAHARGVIHRDLKPSNILLDQAGRPYIGDFGLAHLMEGREELTQSRTLVGTPHYMAPEQGLGLEADHRYDIYSLGVVAYEMLTGTTPFRGPSPYSILIQHMNDPVPVPSRRLVSDAQFAVLKKALAKNREARWQSAIEFVRSLEAGVCDPLLPPAPRPLAVVSRWAWVSAAAAVALLLLWLAAPLEPTAEHIQTSSPPDHSGPQAPAAQSTEPVLPPAAPSTSTSGRGGSSRPSFKTSGNSEPTAPTRLAATPPEIPPEVQTTPAKPGDAPPVEPQLPVAEVTVSPVVIAPIVKPPAGDVLKEPERIRTVKPTFPPPARAAKIQGDVLLQAVILPDGRVTQVTILQSPNRALNNAAIRAVEQSTYRPGLRNGVPGTFTVQVTVSFRLN